MRYSICVGVLALVCGMMTSCSWMIDGDALGASLEPVIAFAYAAHDFRDSEGRWPSSPDELEHHAKLQFPEFDLSKYRVIALVPAEDQSLEIKFAIDSDDDPHFHEEGSVVAIARD